MIDNSDFIKAVGNRKAKIQKLYTRVCRVINILLPCSFKSFQKEEGEYTYLTICSKRGLDMAAASLFSLYKNSDIIPQKVVIVSDGSWEPSYGTNYFARRGLSVCCIPWSDCAARYKNTLPDLYIWAHKQIWGKKMAAILYASEDAPTLFADPDVLWYKTPLDNDDWELPFKISLDCCHSYDQEYISSSGKHFLNDTSEPINCGVVYIRNGLALLNEHALDCIAYEAKHCGKFAEQTVFALMDTNIHSHWSSKEIISSIDDVLDPFFTVPLRYENTKARHYLWRLKWIYWTEYFKMRWMR